MFHHKESKENIVNSSNKKNKRKIKEVFLMSNVRKFFAMAIVFAMVLGVMVPAFAAVAPDVAGTKYEDAATLLGALEIMVGDAEDGNFRPDDTIIRSEFAKVAVAALGLSDIAAGYNHATKFNDVVEGHWAQGYINVAADQGIVIGDPEGTFRPDDPITYAEAITVLVRIIGHEPAALANGAYPTGYLVVAAQNKMTKNATGSANEPAKRGVVAQLVYNALTIDIMEQVGYGSDISYEVIKDKTLLNSKLDVEKLKGQITGNEYTKLTGSGSLDEDEVQIGKETYKVGKTNAKDLLGYNVTYYVREENNEDVLVAVIPNDDENEVITVNADDIHEDTTTSTFFYWIDKDNDDEPEEVDINEEAVMVYNGKVASSFDADDLKPASGRVVLLDNNGDDEIDVIFVTSFNNYVVDKVNTNLNRVYFKNATPSSMKLDPKDDSIKFNIIKDGENIELADLDEWNVLSIAISADKKLINIYVSTDKVEGRVTEEDDDKRYIDGEEYKLAKNLNANDVKLEDEGIFYLDINGDIAAVNTTSNASENYAYLLNGAAVGGVSGGYEFKLLNKEGETVVLTAADKITLNGTKVQAKIAFEDLSTNGKIDRQLITFEVNNNGEIYKIDTAKATADDDAFSRDLAKTELTYTAATRKLGNAQYVDENTIVFDLTGKNDDDYTVRNGSIFKDKGSYEVELYDISEDRTIGAIVLTKSSNSSLGDKNIVLVNRITDTKNADGDSTQKLYGIYKGNKNFSILAEDSSILRNEVSEGVYEPITQGDIIQFEVNANGEISDIEVLFDASANALDTYPEINDADLQTLFVKVVDKVGNKIIVDVDGTRIPYVVDDVDVYEFNAAKKTVSVADAGDIEESDEDTDKYVFIRIYENIVQEIVIFK